MKYLIDKKFNRFIDRSLNFLTIREGPKSVDLRELTDLDRLVRAILEADGDPFQIRIVKCSRNERVPDAIGAPYVVPVLRFVKMASPNTSNAAARKLAELIAQFRSHDAFPSLGDSATRQLRLAPHIALLVELFDRHPIRDCIGRGKDLNQTVSPVSPGVIRAEVYNHFVVQFRQEMQARNLLRRELHNWNLGSLENVTKLDAYLDELFKDRLSLTVCHLRLFHSRDRSDLVSAPVESQHNDLRELRVCRKKFFDCMRRKPALFAGNPAYVWSILPGLGNGYSLHLTLLFDTAALRKVLDDIRVQAGQAGVMPADYQDMIGMYWVQVATAGRGSYLRADRHSGPYHSDRLYGDDWVHGEVSIDDPDRRRMLKETLGYLAMRRALVRLKNEPRGQYFDMRNRQPRSRRRRSSPT